MPLRGVLRADSICERCASTGPTTLRVGPYEVVGSNPMNVHELSAFLARQKPIATEDVVWGESLRLRLSAYLSKDVPPLRYVSSARAVVLRGGSVLVQRDRDSRHIIPGGRLEQNETPEVALRREIGEETGWSLGRVEAIGFLHFRHLDPKQPDYRYPYPSFVQIMYGAEAIAHCPELMIADDYVVGADLMSVAAVRKLELTPKELMYLGAALEVDGLAGRTEIDEINEH